MIHDEFKAENVMVEGVHLLEVRGFEVRDDAFDLQFDSSTVFSAPNVLSSAAHRKVRAALHEGSIQN